MISNTYPGIQVLDFLQLTNFFPPFMSQNIVKENNNNNTKQNTKLSIVKIAATSANVYCIFPF